MIRALAKNFIDHLYNCYHYLYIYLHEIKNIRQKKALWKGVKLTDEQKKEIKSVYGSKVWNKWHRLYQSYTGNYNKDYFPEILFSTKLEPILCPRRICKVLQDKSLLEIIYGNIPGMRLAKTIVVNCSGIIYDGNRDIIDMETAVSLLAEWCRHDSFVIKPNDSFGGMGVALFHPDSGLSREDIMKLLNSYKKNYIIQECLKNCRELKQLYERSVNTFRIMTYIVDSKLYHAPLILRMGKGSNIVDNCLMGGLFIGVSEEGYLGREAYDDNVARYLVHPDSNIRFDGYYIPGIEKIISCAYSCHKRTPHTRFVSWDFTLDENLGPVLIEANMLGHTSMFPQAASGVSTFGSNTKRMVEEIVGR